MVLVLKSGISVRNDQIAGHQMMHCENFSRVSATSLKCGGLTLALLLASMVIVAQPRKYQVIKNDSVKIFCNLSYHLVDAKCAAITRFTRLTTDGKFNGPFADVTGTRLRAKGNYDNGLREGIFEEFDDRGKVVVHASYHNGKPDGEWIVYSQKGAPTLRLTFNGQDTLITYHADERGKADVQDGAGTFTGKPFGNFISLWLRVSGKIENGKRTGEWHSFDASRDETKANAYCTETYERGRAVQRAGLKQKNTVACPSQFDFVPRLKSTELEQNMIGECPPPYKRFVADRLLEGMNVDWNESLTRNSYMKDQEKFKSELKEMLENREFEDLDTAQRIVRIRFIVRITGNIRGPYKISSNVPSMIDASFIGLLERQKWAPAWKEGQDREQFRYFNFYYKRKNGKVSSRYTILLR